MNLSRLRISTRLALGFGAVIALMVVMALSAVVNLRLVRAEFVGVMDVVYPRLAALKRADALTREASLALTSVFVLADSEVIKRQYARIDEIGREVGQILQQLPPETLSPDSRPLLERMLQARATYVADRSAVIASMGSYQIDAARRTLLEGVFPKQETYLKAIEQFIAEEERSMQQAAQAVRDAADRAVLTTLVLLAGAAVGALLLSLAILRSIKRPLDQAVQAARAVAEGDLRQAVQGHGRTETDQLLDALGQMQTSLAGVVQNVRQNADNVAAAAVQIAAGNNDLSARTEEQASALQQTAASMEQLTSSVSGNADSARQASEMARSAREVAERGGAVVGDVVQTMRGINEASRKIADIIGVIDGIAFQTNILALNAAVEAARAGEQGRGFAVVASEVRTLAGRSAEAAREIKGLIGASVERVAHGSELVDKAGKTMGEVVAAIGRVTDLIVNISAAGSEQSAGVSQIGEAVAQMDQTTQQNAALVEQSAAAAEALKAQAQALVQTMAVFQVPGDVRADAHRREAKAPDSTATRQVEHGVGELPRLAR